MIRRDAILLRRMRRLAEDLAAGITPASSTRPGHLVTELCARMSHRLRRPVHLHLVPFPNDDGVSGVWLATEAANHLLCERDTSPLHQVTIAGHELWHMEAGHTASSIDAAVAPRLLLPSLSPDTVARIVARRTVCDAGGERDAELFGSVLATTVGRLLPMDELSAPGAVVRLERVLGPQTREDWLG